jgi:hypothetical protein
VLLLLLLLLPPPVAIVTERGVQHWNLLHSSMAGVAGVGNPTTTMAQQHRSHVTRWQGCNLNWYNVCIGCCWLQAGDVLILTKPLGVGVMTTALKKGILPPEGYDEVTGGGGAWPFNSRAIQGGPEHGMVGLLVAAQ